MEWRKNYCYNKKKTQKIQKHLSNVPQISQTLHEVETQTWSAESLTDMLRYSLK